MASAGLQRYKKPNLNPSFSNIQMLFVNLTQHSHNLVNQTHLSYLGSPAEVRVDMYVANIWAMEEVKMVRVTLYILN